MKVKLSEIKVLTDEQLNTLSRGDLRVVARSWFKKGLALEEYVTKLEERLRKYETYASELEEKIFDIEGKLCRIQSKLFCPSSEKSPRSDNDKEKKEPKPRSSSIKLPSERYPNADIIEKHITYEQAPECKCCGCAMVDSGMMETSEHLTVVPKQYLIIRQHRHKYRCQKCHGDIATTPALPRVIPGSNYSDELIVDATLSKFCDLIPMERYCEMAKRQGFEGLPPHSLIGTSFKLAVFLKSAYERLKQETLNTLVLLADETTHRMLEGDEKTRWFLWGFLSKTSCFYECHDTRSGDVASVILENSTCEVLLSDAYSGYGKAVRETNEVRLANGQTLLLSAYCNSHARRLFVPPKGKEAPPEQKFMTDQYKEIYKIEALTTGQSIEKILELRQQMRPYFEAMKSHAETVIESFSNKSTFAEGFSYFLRYFEGLVRFLTNHLIPIDNNGSERILRNHVVGRKTWYGTHSREGAEVAAIHFSLVESCKLNKVNPRIYYAEIIKRIHSKQIVVTPKEFADIQRMNSPPDGS